MAIEIEESVWLVRLGQRHRCHMSARFGQVAGRAGVINGNLGLIWYPILSEAGEVCAHHRCSCAGERAELCGSLDWIFNNDAACGEVTGDSHAPHEALRTIRN